MSREVKSRKERLVGFILQAFCFNYSNALNERLLFSILEENTLGEVTRWDVQGGSHAFIVMGSNSGEYKKHVQNFIDENIN